MVCVDPDGVVYMCMMGFLTDFALVNGGTLSPEVSGTKTIATVCCSSIQIASPHAARETHAH